MKNWRAWTIFVFFIIFAAVITGRLIFLQVIKKDYYRALAQGQQRLFITNGGDRGQIFFGDGKTLATNIKQKYVFTITSKVKNKELTAASLADALKLDKTAVLDKINSVNPSEKIKEGISNEEEAAVKGKNLDGIYVSEETLRKYPQGQTASQVLGFVGGEGSGQYGVEGFYDDLLRPKDNLDASYANGADLYLTLDPSVQFMAEKLLDEAKGTLDIEGGMIIVVDPSTLKIKALANYPQFNPNSFSGVKDFNVFQNSAVQKIFEPGSVFKPITMVSALDQGKITPDAEYTDDGYVKIGGSTIYNYGNRTWGKMTMTGVLERSINTGAVFAEKKLGNSLFLDYLKNFGFFEKTGVDLQGEVFSQNLEFKKGYEINYATASFGQGIEMTPLQLVRAFSAIANGGKLMKPYIVDKISNNGKITQTSPEVDEDQVASSKAISQVTSMMVSVVENGYGKEAKVPGYYIAGKTGTAQIPWSALGISKKGYSDETWQSFIGFAPAFNPRFLILVKLDNPKAKTAEYSATPIFQKLAKYIIDLWQIPPDYEIK